MRMEVEGRNEKVSKAQMYEQSGGSFAILLAQVVQSENSTHICKLLHECSAQPKVLINTVKRIPRNIIHTLLTTLTQELLLQPDRTTSVIKWLKAIVTTHLTYVSTNEKCRETLDQLYDIVKPQEDLHVPLLALQGKIQLLQAYVKQNNNSNEGEEEEGTNSLAKSAVVYDDDSEDDTEELWREVGRINDHVTSEEDEDLGMEDTTTGSDGEEEEEEEGMTGTDGDEGGGSELSDGGSEGD